MTADRSPRSPRFHRVVVLACVLVAVVAACGDGDDRTEAAGSGDESGDAADTTALSDALLAESDVPGWTAHDDVEWQGPKDCSGQPADVAGLDDGLTVEFSRDDPSFGEVRGLFQDVIAFADETAATAYLASLSDSMSSCVGAGAGEAQPGQLVIESATPLDLTGPALGEAPVGWRMSLAPPSGQTAAEADPGALLSNMDLVGIQRGRYVSVVTRFVPLAEDLDVTALAATAYERLPH